MLFSVTVTLLPQARLAALTEHEERCTVASESLPANLRKTMPARDMRSCILNRETKRTWLEAQWSTTRDFFFSHLDMGSIGWVEKHFVYRDIGCRRWEGRHFRMLLVRADHSRSVCAYWRAELLFASRRTPASRALRPSCTAVRRERLAIPTGSQP